MMRLIARDIPLSLDAMLIDNRKAFIREVSHALGVKPSSFCDVRIERKSIDARKKDNVHFVVSVSFDPILDKPLSFWQDRASRGVKVDVFKPVPDISIPDVGSSSISALPASSSHAGASDKRPIVVGAGPAGLFCALYLAKAGMRPILIERGEAVQDRIKTVRAFNEGSSLDSESNIQFGEGGAGTFSDGKLNTGTKSPFNTFVLNTFVAAGAPDDILVDTKPHIGTDNLVKVVAGLRQNIIASGGEVRFSTKLTGIELDDRRCVTSAIVKDAAAGELCIPTDRIILACGHSARDVFDLMKALDVVMERKPFAVGVRIEHPQKLIDAIQYGKAASHPALPSADYKLAVKTGDGRGVYSFCMCPGGSVVAAASEDGGVCVNGMSDHARDGRNANSAILVEVRPDDLEGEDVLEGIALQRELESAAYELGGGCYSAPCQDLTSFLGEKLPQIPEHLKRVVKRLKPISPTYPRGVRSADIRGCLPKFVSDSLFEGLLKMDDKMRGFAYGQARLTATEARSSSPVRICRDRKGLQSVNTPGLYPTGEGAGYAGGIMSAATDGLRVAARIVEEELLKSETSLAVSALRSGKPVVFPTDTVCGLGVSMLHHASIERLYEIKGRSRNKPFQWLVKDASALEYYGADLQPYVRALADAFWPGALTLIVKASDSVSRSCASDTGTIGLRMPDDEVALGLIRELGCPIISTSANRSGEAASSTIEELDSDWLEAADVLVVHGFSSLKGSSSKGIASTVVDCTKAQPEILREGSVTADDIRRAI